MPSWYSSSASLQPLSATFVHSLCCTPELKLSPRGELLHMSGTLVFMSGDPVFMAVPQRTPLDCLTLEAKQSCIPCPTTATIRETVLGRLPLPGHYTDSRLKYTPVFLRKRPICLYRSFDLKGRLPVWQTSRSSWRGSNRTKTSGHIFALSFCLTLAHWHLPERSVCL